MSISKLPIPPHFDPETVGKVWKVNYQQRAQEAEQWAVEHKIQPVSMDNTRVALLLVDVQNTFCIPDYELYVAGRSGTGAVDDNRRLCRFIYEHLGIITRICATMDTHRASQIFHAVFLVDDEGNHPEPLTTVTVEDIRKGRWKFNKKLSSTLGVSDQYAQKHLLHYVQRLAESGKYDLTIWPYHAMLGGIGHALVSAVEEAVFFHDIARCSQADIRIKGENAFTENYSVISPEVIEGPEGKKIAGKNVDLIETLFHFDTVIVAGQAKSHCLAWTMRDLIAEVKKKNVNLMDKIYLLEDCCSPVVVPDVVDFTMEADQAFKQFAEEGVHIVRTSEPIEKWPQIRL